MKLTNNKNLPNAIVKAIEQNAFSSKGGNRASVTSLLLPAQEIVLRERFKSEMVQDVSDMINLLFGNAVHDYLERHDDGEQVEMFVDYEMFGYTISGKVDVIEGNTLYDYKTAKVNKVIYEDFDDWRKQGMIYAWLLSKNQIAIDRIKFIALLKDWSRYSYVMKTRQDDYYPDSAVYVYEVKVRADDIVKTEEYVTRKIKDIKRMKEMTVQQLLDEPLDEDFAPVKKYAVMKKGAKRASKVFESKQEAKNFAKGDMYIEERVEPNMKFEVMCNALQYASKIKNLKEETKSWESPF